jgi:predicted GNAT family N-acyltransferase
VEGLAFVKGYRDNEELRKSFNQLASNTFGIEFETWYQKGFWTDKYRPYSYIVNGKVVANVSVNLIQMVINKEVKQAIQIGTVMTDPDYRNRSLSRQLMDIVLADFLDVDLIYLFANQTVLDFYPKFGFHSMEEVQFSLEFSHKPANLPRLKRLDGSNPEDLAFIYQLAGNRNSISKTFGTIRSEELLMFYCLMVFSQDLYYLEDENALVIFQDEGECLHLYDVVSPGKVNIQSILNKIVTSNSKKVVFHYHPDESELNFNKQPYQSSNVFFIKNLTNVLLPSEIKHPLTSQA